MPFTMPDIVIESIILDGLENAITDLSVIDDVFGNMTRSFATRKYGQSEIDKIKRLITNKEINIVHSFNLVPTNLPCYSIQLADDVESVAEASMGDYEQFVQQQLTDPDALAALGRVPAFTPTAYNATTGFVSVDDSVDLSAVYANLLFVDGAGVEHYILAGISNVSGRKGFTIEKGLEGLSLAAGAEIKSSIDFEQFKVRGNHERSQLIIGVHTNDALTTKYLYILLKYFLMSRKQDIISRDLQLTTYTGSDFQRNMEYASDTVFTRFLHLQGLTINTWRSDKVQLIDNVNITVIPVEK